MIWLGMTQNLCQMRQLLSLAEEKGFAEYHKGAQTIAYSFNMLSNCIFQTTGKVRYSSQPYRCLYCGCGFWDMESLQEHLRHCTRQLQLEAPQCPERSIMCEFCFKTARFEQTHQESPSAVLSRST